MTKLTVSEKLLLSSSLKVFHAVSNQDLLISLVSLISPMFCLNDPVNIDQIFHSIVLFPDVSHFYFQAKYRIP